MSDSTAANTIKVPASPARRKGKAIRNWLITPFAVFAASVCLKSPLVGGSAWFWLCAGLSFAGALALRSYYSETIRCLAQKEEMPARSRFARLILFASASVFPLAWTFFENLFETGQSMKAAIRPGFLISGTGLLCLALAALFALLMFIPDDMHAPLICKLHGVDFPEGRRIFAEHACEVAVWIGLAAAMGLCVLVWAAAA